RITHSQQTPDEQFAYCSKTETIKPDYASRAVTRSHLLPAVSAADRQPADACRHTAARPGWRQRIAIVAGAGVSPRPTLAAPAARPGSHAQRSADPGVCRAPGLSPCLALRPR